MSSIKQDISSILCDYSTDEVRVVLPASVPKDLIDIEAAIRKVANPLFEDYQDHLARVYMFALDMGPDVAGVAVKMQFTYEVVHIIRHQLQKIVADEILQGNDAAMMLNPNYYDPTELFDDYSQDLTEKLKNIIQEHNLPVAAMTYPQYAIFPRQHLENFNFPHIINVNSGLITSGDDIIEHEFLYKSSPVELTIEYIYEDIQNSYKGIIEGIKDLETLEGIFHNTLYPLADQSIYTITPESLYGEFAELHQYYFLDLK